MVRKSKLPEISLHQDNKKLLQDSLRLAQDGTINIYPTQLGGKYSVTTLQSVLESEEYIKYDDNTKKLTFGELPAPSYTPLFPGDPAPPAEYVDNVTLYANNKIQFGESSGNNTLWDSSGQILLESNSIDMNCTGNVNFFAENININADVFAISSLQNLNIGNDSSGNNIAENIRINTSNSLQFDASGSIVVNGDTIQLNGELLAFYGTLDFQADMVFTDQLDLRGGSLIKLMTDSSGNQFNDARTHGIYFDSSGYNCLYYADSSGYTPAGTHPPDVSDNNQKKIRIRVDTSGGFILENKNDDILLSIDGDNGDAIIKGNLDLSGRLDLSGNIVIGGDITADAIRIDSSGNIDSSGIINAATFNSNNLNIIGDISGTGTTITCNSVSSKQLETEGIRIDLSGNFDCSGNIFSNSVVTGSLNISGNILDSSGLIMNENTICTFDELIVNKYETDTGGIVIDNNTITSVGSLTIGGDITSTGDINCAGEIKCNNMDLFDSSGILYAQFNTDGLNILSGNISCDTLTTGILSIDSGISIDATTGIIKGQNIEVSGYVETNKITTDNITIDSTGIDCTGEVSARIYNIKDSYGNINNLVDGSGNMTIPGFLSIGGNVETLTGSVTVGGDIDIGNGDLTCNTVFVQNMTLGNASLDASETGTSNLDLSGCLLIKDTDKYSYIQSDKVVCGDSSGNTLQILNDKIEFTNSSHWDSSGFYVPYLKTDVLNVVGSELNLDNINTMNGSLAITGDLTSTHFSTTGDFNVYTSTESNNYDEFTTQKFMTSNSLVTIESDSNSGNILVKNGSSSNETVINSESIECKTSSGNYTKIESDKIDIQNSSGDSILITSTSLTGTSLTVNDINVNGHVSFGSTYTHEVFPSEFDPPLAQITIEIDQYISSSDETEYGPEYNVILEIIDLSDSNTDSNYDSNDSNSNSKKAIVIFTVNFGSFFKYTNFANNPSVSGGNPLIKGALGDKYLNGPDRIKNIICDDEILLGKLKELNYSRGFNNNFIVISGDEFSEIGNLKYTYYYTKGVGLGFK